MKQIESRILLSAAILLFSALGASAQSVQNGIHLQTSTTYDFTSHQGTICVESFVEGHMDIIHQSIPLDIVLVLDVSESMQSRIPGEPLIPYENTDPERRNTDYYALLHWGGGDYGRYISKLGHMMDACWSFVSTIGANARKDSVEHRIGIVTFSSDGTKVMDLTPVSGNEDKFRKEIYKFKSSGNTETDKGLEIAKDIFSEQNRTGKKKDDVMRTVVLFTDGEPSELLLFNMGIANRAISTAKMLKGTTFACTIYTVGMFEGKPDIQVETFMNALSSNHPIASDMYNTADKVSSDYYLNASTASELNSIFDGISADIIVGGSLVDLQQDAQIRDYMPPHMCLPEGTSASDIHCYKSRCLSYDPKSREFTFSAARDTVSLPPDGISISYDDDGCAMVCVNGFNYKNNWCGTGMRNGHKLIVEIPFVITNVSEDGEFNPNSHKSGLYDDSGAPAAILPAEILYFYNLTVERSGLLSGENAVYRVIDLDSHKTICRFALTHDRPIRTIRMVPQGRYRVIEEDWNWAYRTDPDKTRTITLDAHTTLKFQGDHREATPIHDEKFWKMGG